MMIYLSPIFEATTIEKICAALQQGLDSLRNKKYLDNLPESYHGIAAKSPTEIQEWFDTMKEDDQAQEEGNLKEIVDLFDAALRQLRKYGFHRS